MTTVTPMGAYARHLGDGFVRALDQSAWLYYRLPSQPPVYDADSWEDNLKASQPLKIILPRLASLVPDLPPVNRDAIKSFYRHIHILAISTPYPFTPSPGLDENSRRRLAAQYADQSEHDRFTLFGVKLTTGDSRRKRRSPWARFARLLLNIDSQDAYGLISDSVFDDDRSRIMTILTDAGCTPPSESMMRRAFAWWQTSQKPESVPMMIEPTHAHTFPSLDACAKAELLKQKHTPCRLWREAIPGSFPLTFATLGMSGLNQTDEHDPRVPWAARLMASATAGGQGAIALSIRGLVEPYRYTKEWIDKDQRNVMEKTMKQAEDSYRANERLANELTVVNDTFQQDGEPWPTLVDTAVHVAIPDLLDRTEQVMYPGEVRLNPGRQDSVFQSMMIGSDLQYNPSPTFWPTPLVAYAGVSGRSFAGEDTGRGLPSDSPGALLGLSETDRLACYVSPTVVARVSKQPIMVCLGQVGSGKTYTLLHLATQWGRMPNPDDPSQCLCGVFFNPKSFADDFGPFIRATGGREYRLDDPRAVGVLDPVRCMSHDGQFFDDMMNTAVEMLSQITGHDWSDRAYQNDLMSIIGFGLRQGADCTGEAVRLAAKAKRENAGARLPETTIGLWERLERLADASGLFRIIYGREHGGFRLNASTGMTLISAGNLNVIPEKSSTSSPSMIQRWVTRMAALGSAGAIIGRNGFVVIDEAWALLGDEFGAAIVERFGRLARAQKYLPILASQKVNEFVDTGVSEFISRGLILALPARNEKSGRVSQAQAACMLFDQSTTGRLHERLTHEKVLDVESNEPDYDSLYALSDPATGRLLRGPIAYYVGLDGHAIPVEVRIPVEEMRLIKGPSR